MKQKIKTFILFLISLIEKYEYRNIELDESDNDKKILDSLIMNELVLSDDGFNHAIAVHKTQPYQIYEIVTESGKKLSCADNHILFDEDMHEVFACDLNVNSQIHTKHDIERIVKIKKRKRSVGMFDITVNSNNHRFYSNEILSHNTVTSAIFLAWYAIFHFDRNILVVANRLGTTVEIIDKIKHVIKNLPFFMKPGIISDGKTGMHFENNCRLFSQATTATAALGFAIHLLYADEFAHIHNNLVRPFYRSIYPTLASSKISKIIISSTPNGKNLFYELWSGATKHKNDYHPIRVDWWEVPGRDEAWQAREIANLGSIELFNQEYGNQFLESNRMLLGANFSKFLERTTHKFIHKEVYAFHPFDFDYHELKWAKNFNPDNIDENDKFIFTMDISDGIGQDYTVINMFKLEVHSAAQIRKKRIFWDEGDFFRVRQVGIFSSNSKAPAEVAEILQHIIFDLFNEENTATVIEANFKAAVVFEILSRHNKFYPELLVHTKHSANARFPKPGVKTTKGNRDTYIRTLKTMLNDKRIVVQDRNTYEEINNFGINNKGKFEAQIGHDDIAMTLVFLIPFFDSEQFAEMVESLYDSQKQSVVSLIDKRLENMDDDSDNDIEYAKLLNS